MRGGYDVNIIEGIQQECNRCRELVTEYEAIGQAGAFGKLAIKGRIKQGEDAIASGDITRMVEALQGLKGCASVGDGGDDEH